MSIYEALGHKIAALEKHVEQLQRGNGIAREALVELLATFESLAEADPSIRTKYAHIEAFAKKALADLEG